MLLSGLIFVACDEWGDNDDDKTFSIDWKGSMLFTGLRGQALYRVVFDSEDLTKIDMVERYLPKRFGRLRNVVET